MGFFVLGSGAALGQEADPCLGAPVEGQELQKAGRLLEARDRFVVCARDTCPAEIVQDCTRWTREVEEALPSVVVGARDGDGQDLQDVRVGIDGGEAAAVSARAIPLNPGGHRFVFRRQGRPDVEKQIVLHEGEKNREVIATFGVPSAVRSTPIPPPVLERPVPISAWTTGAVAAASLATFAVFATLGLSTRSADNCARGCTLSQYDTVTTYFRVADVTLGIGIAGAALATVLYLVRPTTVRHPSALFDVRAAPGAAVLTSGVRF
jgi:hypothetical protein